MQRPRHAAGTEYDRTAKAARYVWRGSRTKRGFANALEADDLQVGVPEAIFLAAEPLLNALQHVGVLARRQHAIVARAGHPEIFLERIGGAGGQGARSEDPHAPQRGLGSLSTGMDGAARSGEGQENAVAGRPIVRRLWRRGN